MKTVLSAVMAVIFMSIASSTFAADPVVAAGEQVKLDYTLTVNNEKIESSIGKKPLQVVIGSKKIIPGLENALIGMHVGEEKVITVDPKDAYGDADPEAIKEFPASSMPKGIEPKKGMVLQAQAPDGESFPAVVEAVNGDKVMLNFNHPLAGKQLKFQVKILDIQPAPATPAVPMAPVMPTKK